MHQFHPSKTRIALVAGILAVIAGLGYYWYSQQPRKGVEAFTETYDLVLGTYEGTEVPLDEYKRSLLVIHSWASWCTYCAEELQNLAKLKDVYGEDVHILAVNRAESMAEARAFTDSLGLGDKIEILVDPTDSLYKDIEGYAMPETVFINKKGEIIFHQRGPMKVDEVIERIDVLIGKE